MISATTLAALTDEVGAAVESTPSLLADYAADWWPLATKRAALGDPIGRPAGVVTPTDAEQVARLVAFATAHGVPLVPWGLGSSVVGSPLAEADAILCDLSQLTGIVALSDEDLLVRVRAGMLGSDLEEELATYGLTTGHSPQSLDRSTVGGWVATRATGQFSSRYGGIEDMLVALEVALPGHGLVRTPISPRPALGPDLAGLLVGSEGTFGIITEVTLRVQPIAETRLLDTLRFEDVGTLIDALRGIARSGIRPFLVRGYDHAETAHVSAGDLDGCALMIGVEGPEGPARADYDATVALATAAGGSPVGPAVTEAWMGRRYDFSTIENLVASHGGYAETIEVAALWSKAEAVHAAVTGALAGHAQEVLGHFSHIYPQGTSLYVILLGQAEDDTAAVAALEGIWPAAMRACEESGAAIAHHHGVGIARLPWLPNALGATAGPLEAVKRALDPAGVCNPGKLTVPPRVPPSGQRPPSEAKP